MSQRDFPEFTWYGAGWAIFKSGQIIPDFLPPLDDLKVQHEWLEGFQAAWVEYPVLENFRYDNNGLPDWDDVSPSVEKELERKLAKYPQLLRQLKSALVHEGN
jgi:hypothetical protein